jgi:DNA-binding NarL/FixJ family response regulator
MKVVVADDDANIRRSLAFFLSDAGHDVLQATDGRKAVELAAAHAPDLVLLDLRMPHMDGLTALRHLAAEHPELPVIVISGAGQVADAVEAMRLGAWDYLSKPIDDLSLLTVAIEKVVEKRDLRRQVREYQLNLEEQVRQRTAQLQVANQALENKAVALREILNTVQEEKRECQRAILSRIETTVLPLVRRAREGIAAAVPKLLAQIEEHLGELDLPFADQLARRFARLTPSELRICQAIRRGMSSKEIAQADGITAETVETHRKSIRRKLNITNEHVNLATYLQSLDEIG